VLASGANVQKSIGFATLTGMIGSTPVALCGVAADRGEADVAKGPIRGVAADE
jgi:hypothetical protein